MEKPVPDLASTCKTAPSSVLLSTPDKFDPSQIRKIPLKLKSVTRHKKLAFLLENVFTPEECKQLINLSEDVGYSPALVNIGNGLGIRAHGYRDSLRVLIDDKEFVSILFKRISNHLPSNFQGEELVEINERLRFLRYDPGDQFKKHYDGVYTRPDDSAETLITLQMYLNEGFEGGETTFLCDIPEKFNERQEEKTRQDRPNVPVVPKTGMILVFEHKILHEGSLLKSGRKYTIRTDVLYTKTPGKTYNKPVDHDEESDDEKSPVSKEKKTCTIS